MMAKKIRVVSPKPTDEDQVEQWMNNLDSPLKPGINLLRSIIKAADKRIRERIKWNAPSYYYNEDIVTFGPRKDNKILLVFHHPHVVKVKSEILEGNYKDRRLAWFADANEIKARKKELTGILKELTAFIDRQKT